MKWLIQFDLDGRWVTIARRGNFTDACRKGWVEYRAMKGQREVSIIREDDLDSPILRRFAADNFKLL